MAKKGFNLHTDELSEKIEQRREQAAAQMGQAESRPTIRVDKGMNVFWILPGIGETIEPVMDMLFHYGPFHRCGRKDPIPKGDDFVKDGSFRNCIRCQTAWNTWADMGRPEGEAKAKFRSDMESHQAVFQAFDFSPFFKTDSSGNFAKADKKTVANHLDDFLEIVAEETHEARQALADEKVSDGLPEDIAEAAVASPGMVRVNSNLGKLIREAHEVYKIETGEDPLGSPGSVLLQIKRVDGGQSFVGRDGKKRYQGEYTVRFTAAKMMKDWKVDEDQLISLALERAVDMLNIEPESDSLRDRALALEKFTDDEIVAYLEESDHTYDYRQEQQEDEVGGGDDDFGSEEDMNPDDFDMGLLSVEDQAESAAIKAQLLK